MSKLYIIVGTIVVLMVVGTLGFMLCSSSIKPGEVGIPVVFGKPTGEVWQPGLHWKVPFFTRVVRYKTLAQSYETSDNPDSSGANHTDWPITAQTIDGQQITIKTTTLFKVSSEDPIGVLTQVGDMNAIVENVVKAHTRNLVRLYAQGYSAETLYSGDGIFDFQEQVSLELHDELSQRGIHLDDFLLRKIDFDEEYMAVIEDQQQAKERIETAEYEAQAAEFEKQKQIRAAEAEAERKKLDAQANQFAWQAEADATAYKVEVESVAEADRQRLLADSQAYEIEVLARAQADSLRLRGQQLTAHPALVQWRMAENLQSTRWGILPDDVVLPLLPTLQSLE